MMDGYPINYEHTLAIAKKEAAFGKAVADAEEIERRWTRISECTDYTLADLRKETLLDDIAVLLQCVIVFLNKVDEQTALAQHRRPGAPKRTGKKIHWGRLKG